MILREIYIITNKVSRIAFMPQERYLVISILWLSNILILISSIVVIFIFNRNPYELLFCIFLPYISDLFHFRIKNWLDNLQVNMSPIDKGHFEQIIGFIFLCILPSIFTCQFPTIFRNYMLSHISKSYFNVLKNFIKIKTFSVNLDENGYTDKLQSIFIPVFVQYFIH